MENISLSSNNRDLDPSKFDATVEALMFGLGAEKYIELFRKRNIGLSTLTELDDEDLKLIGVDDGNIRKAIIDHVKNLPVYQHNLPDVNRQSNIGLQNIVQILEDSSTHLHRLHLSVLANYYKIKKTKIIPDPLLYRDKYASDIAISSINEIIAIINTADYALHNQFKKDFEKEDIVLRKKKIIIGSLGTVTISILALLFARSLKQL